MNKNLEEREISILVNEVVFITCKNMLISNSTFFLSLNGIISNIIMLYLLVSLIKLRIFIKKNVKVKYNINSLLIISLILFFWGVSVWDHGYVFSNIYVKDDVVAFLTYSLFALLIIPVSMNIEIVLDELYRNANLLFVFSLIGFFLFYQSGAHILRSYNMTYGKNAVFGCIILYSKYKTQHKIKDLLLALIMTTEIILIGSRFPILFIIAYMLVWILELIKNEKHGLAYLMLFITISMIFILNWDYLANRIYSFLSKFNISSRTIDYVLKNNWNSSGRDYLHEKLIEGVNKKPFLGYGMGGSVIILDGELAHGFIYDAFAMFGYIGGSMFIFCTFLYIICTMWKHRKHRKITELFMLFSCCFFPCILIQESIFGAYKFWWLIAFCMSLRKIRSKCFL